MPSAAVHKAVARTKLWQKESHSGINARTRYPSHGKRKGRHRIARTIVSVVDGPHTPAEGENTD